MFLGFKKRKHQFNKELYKIATEDRKIRESNQAIRIKLFFNNLNK